MRGILRTQVFKEHKEGKRESGGQPIENLECRIQRVDTGNEKKNGQSFKDRRVYKWQTAGVGGSF